MAYHEWGEKDFDWKGLDAAGDYIGDNLVRWGRVNVRDVKEKYGSLRIYLSFGWFGLHSFTHPRHAYIRYKRDGLLWKLNSSYAVLKIFDLLNHVVVPYHILLYKYFYWRATKKWPHLADEIVDAADYCEYLGFKPRKEEE